MHTPQPDPPPLGGIVPRAAAPVLAAFGLPGARLRADLPIPGSPERCLARAVAEDGQGRLWLVERLFGGQGAARERVARFLAALVQGGVGGVPAFRAAATGGHCVRADGAGWQVSPFVPGDPLPRPAYIEDAERGTALADFLADMRAAAQDGTTLSDDPAPGDAFHDAPAAALPDYVDGLLAAVGRTRPDLLPVLAPVREGVGPLLAQWHRVPHGPCHGDFHPLNVIWRGRGVAAVIDWEFAGRGPDLYDAANMLGCVGMEDPRALMRGLCRAFVHRLRERGVLTVRNERFLHPLVTAVRFAWLSEWLRKDDHGMLDTELAYMPLLANSAQALGRAWGVRG